MMIRGLWMTSKHLYNMPLTVYFSKQLTMARRTCFCQRCLVFSRHYNEWLRLIYKLPPMWRLVQIGFLRLHSHLLVPLQELEKDRAWVRGEKILCNCEAFIIPFNPHSCIMVWREEGIHSILLGGTLFVAKETFNGLLCFICSAESWQCFLHLPRCLDNSSNQHHKIYSHLPGTLHKV